MSDDETETDKLDRALREAASEHTYDEIWEFGREWTRCEEHMEAHRTLAAEVRRLREEHDRCYPHGVDIVGFGVLYGKKETCKLLGAWMQELFDYRRKEARTEEVDRLQVVVADQALTIGTLKDEIDRLRADDARVRNEWEDQNAELAKLDAQRRQVVGEIQALQAENAELRKAERRGL